MSKTDKKEKKIKFKNINQIIVAKGPKKETRKKEKNDFKSLDKNKRNDIKIKKLDIFGESENNLANRIKKRKNGEKIINNISHKK